MMASTVKSFRSGMRWMAPALLLVSASACSRSGPDIVEVSGVVQFNDQPLSMALVKFVPEAGARQSVAMTDEQGRYRLKFTNSRYGAVVGQHRVRITSALPASPDDGLGKPFPGRKELLPKKYHDETELVVEVTPRNQEVNFDLAAN